MRVAIGWALVLASVPSQVKDGLQRLGEKPWSLQDAQAEELSTLKRLSGDGPKVAKDVNASPDKPKVTITIAPAVPVFRFDTAKKVYDVQDHGNLTTRPFALCADAELDALLLLEESATTVGCYSLVITAEGFRLDPADLGRCKRVVQKKDCAIGNAKSEILEGSENRGEFKPGKWQ